MPLPQATVKWFVATQARWFQDHGIPEWFHGVITRKDAENLLLDKAPGCFLVRISESRVGYTLSYRTQGRTSSEPCGVNGREVFCQRRPDFQVSSGNNRCRHFMINVLDDGQFLMPGDERKHRTLEDLVNFHLLHPIQTYNELLVQPCQQNGTKLSNYKELFPHDKIPLKRTTGWLTAPPKATDSSSGPVLNTPVLNRAGNVPLKPPIPQPRRRSEPPPPLPPPLPLPRRMLSDQISDSKYESLAPLRARESVHLYPKITAEMRAMSLSNDATYVMPKLYPWKNNMKKSMSVDCLDLLDSKLEIKPEVSTASKTVRFTETPGPAGQVSAKSSHVSNIGSPNVGKKLKKYILINKALSAMADGKMAISKRELGPGGRNVAVHAHMGRPLNEGSTSLSGNVTTSRKLNELGTSPALLRNIVPLAPNKLRSRTEMVTPYRRREFIPSQEEYRQPPPYAPGF